MRRITLLAYCSIAFANDSLFDKPSSITAVNMIKSNGYPVEEHSVQTDDGYILKLHRIPNFNKTVVFLQHGLVSCSADWLLLGPDKSLAFILHDLGYDVWLGNTRGNTYSRSHIKMSPKSRQFWKFSWHEIAMHDLPAMIKFVLEKSNKEKLHYVGHSQGTTIFFVLNSKNPRFSKKMESAHLLAPVAYMGHIKSPLIQLVAPMFGKPGQNIGAFGSMEIFPMSRAYEMFTTALCHERSAAIKFCANVLFELGGYNNDNLNKTIIQTIMAISPSGSSSRQAIHYFQEYLSKRFREWDYGPSMNQQIYGSSEPPDYPVDKIKVPTYLYYSKNDYLSSDVDVERIARELPEDIVKDRYLVPDHKFTHLDYLYGLNSKEMVYDRIVANLKKI